MPPIFEKLFPRNPWLSGFSQETVLNEARLKARKLAPVVQAPGLQFSYAKVDISEMNRVPRTDRAPYGPIRMGSMKRSLVDVSLQQNAFGIPLDETVLPVGNGGQPVLYADTAESATRKAARVILLRNELDTRDVLTDLANYPTSNKDTLVGAEQWTDTAGSDPIADAQRALAAITIQAEGTYTQMSAYLLTWQALARHPLIKAQVQYTESTSLTAMTAMKIAQLLGFDRGVILDAAYDISVEGDAAANIQWMWGRDVLFQVLDDNPGEQASSHAVTFSLYGEKLVESDVWIQANHPLIDLYYSIMVNKVQIINPYAGYLLKDAVAAPA